VGACAAGLAAADQARRRASVVLIDLDPHRPYNRLSLTRYLAGQITADELQLLPAAGVDLVQGEVVRVQRDAREVLLRDGRHFGYERLVLANGSHPFVPPLPGSGLAGVTSLRTLVHADDLLAAAKPGARCVCVGGGLLGLEAAAALAARGMVVTILEGSSHLLCRQLAEPAAALVKQRLEALGLTVLCGVKIAEITGDARARTVRLADGADLAADIVLLATGVRPNKVLAVDCGLATNLGIIVDDAMRTSDPAIFAAGDVAEHRGVVYGLWPVAQGQGAVAGANAAGDARTFRPTPPATQLKVLDLPVLSLGTFEPADATYTVHERRDGTSYRRIVVHDGAIVGANLVGDLALAGVITRAVEQRLPRRELPPELLA
jgi:nitrite reductase (NADH) large subunit